MARTIEEFCGQKKKDLEKFQSGFNFILNFYCCRYKKILNVNKVKKKDVYC